MEEADCLGDMVGVMMQARLVRLGTPHELKMCLGQLKLRGIDETTHMNGGAIDDENDKNDKNDKNDGHGVCCSFLQQRGREAVVAQPISRDDLSVALGLVVVVSADGGTDGGTDVVKGAMRVDDVAYVACEAATAVDNGGVAHSQAEARRAAEYEGVLVPYCGPSSAEVELAMSSVDSPSKQATLTQLQDGYATGAVDVADTATGAVDVGAVDGVDAGSLGTGTCAGDANRVCLMVVQAPAPVLHRVARAITRIIPEAAGEIAAAADAATSDIREAVGGRKKTEKENTNTGGLDRMVWWLQYTLDESVRGSTGVGAGAGSSHTETDACEVSANQVGALLQWLQTQRDLEWSIGDPDLGQVFEDASQGFEKVGQEDEDEENGEGEEEENGEGDEDEENGEGDEENGEDEEDGDDEDENTKDGDKNEGKCGTEDGDSNNEENGRGGMRTAGYRRPSPADISPLARIPTQSPPRAPRYHRRAASPLRALLWKNGLIFSRQKSHVICQIVTTIAVLATISALQMMAEDSLADVTTAYATGPAPAPTTEAVADGTPGMLSGREQVLQMLGPASTSRPFLPCVPWPVYGDIGTLSAGSSKDGVVDTNWLDGYCLTFFQYAIEPWLIGSDTMGTTGVVDEAGATAKLNMAISALDERVGDLNRTTDPGRGLLGQVAAAWGGAVTATTTARKQCRLHNFTCDGAILDKADNAFCRPAIRQLTCGEAVGHVTAEDAGSCSEETAGLSRRLATTAEPGADRLPGLTADSITGFVNPANDDDWYKCDLQDFTCAAKVGRTYVNNGGRREEPCCKKLYHGCTDCSPLDACQCLFGAMEDRPGGCAAVSAYSVTEHTKASTGCRVYSCWASLSDSITPPCPFMTPHDGPSWEMS
jgi:hypothetical protein